MIGKVLLGKSFGRCLAYCLQAEKIGVVPAGETSPQPPAPVLCYHQCFGTARELATQFSDVSALRPRLSRPVLHVVLSLAPGERLEEKALQHLVAACARDMGFARHQYLAVEHRDTHHQHLHLVVNRVGVDGRVVSDAHSYRRVAQFCRRMERELGLQVVQSPRRFLSPQQRQVPRHDHRKEDLEGCIRATLSTANTYPQFAARMQALGYRVERGRGIAFIDDRGVRIKGSEVGYPLGRLEGVFREGGHHQGLRVPAAEQREAQKVHLAPLVSQGAHHPTIEAVARAQEMLRALTRHPAPEDPVPREWLHQKKGKKQKPSI